MNNRIELYNKNGVRLVYDTKWKYIEATRLSDKQMYVSHESNSDETIDNTVYYIKNNIDRIDYFEDKELPDYTISNILQLLQAECDCFWRLF